MRHYKKDLKLISSFFKYLKDQLSLFNHPSSWMLTFFCPFFLVSLIKKDEKSIASFEANCKKFVKEKNITNKVVRGLWCLLWWKWIWLRRKKKNKKIRNGMI